MRTGFLATMRLPSSMPFECSSTARSSVLGASSGPNQDSSSNKIDSASSSDKQCVTRASDCSTNSTGSSGPSKDESTSGSSSMEGDPGNVHSHLPKTKQVRVVLLLASTAFDYIMRCHCCNWYTPTALHNGGWCMCIRNGSIEGAQGSRQTTGRKRGRQTGASAMQTEVRVKVTVFDLR
jgi:hypothetical protein